MASNGASMFEESFTLRLLPFFKGRLIVVFHVLTRYVEVWCLTFLGYLSPLAYLFFFLCIYNQILDSHICLHEGSEWRGRRGELGGEGYGEDSPVCAVRLPLQTSCLLTHANYLGTKLNQKTYNFIYSFILQTKIKFNHCN